MCGLFTITPKSAPKRPKPGSESFHEAPRPISNYQQAPTHARVNAIMGTPSSSRTQRSASLGRQDAKYRVSLPLKGTWSSNVSPARDQPPNYESRVFSNGALRSKSLDNLKYEAKWLNGIRGSQPRPRTRPRLYERGKYSSSPLANIVLNTSTTSLNEQKPSRERQDDYQQDKCGDPDRIEVLPSITHSEDEGVRAIDFQPLPPFSAETAHPGTPYILRDGAGLPRKRPYSQGRCATYNHIWAQEVPTPSTISV